MKYVVDATCDETPIHDPVDEHRVGRGIGEMVASSGKCDSSSAWGTAGDVSLHVDLLVVRAGAGWYAPRFAQKVACDLIRPPERGTAEARPEGLC